MTTHNHCAFPAGDDDVPGLTKREYMATAIMAGFAADGSPDTKEPHLLGDYAVKCADALIAALNKTEAP